MPSGKAKKEDKAKLDAAMAIAALSNGSWDPAEQQAVEANPHSRRTGAHSKRGGRGKSLTKINSSNGSHVTTPVMPARAKNLAKLKPMGDVSNDLSESDIPKSQTAAVDHLQEGKFIRSAKQTVPTSLTGSGSTWYRPPWYKPPESPLHVQSPLHSPELTVTNSVAVTAGGTASEAKQTNGFLMTSLASLLLPGSGFQLVPLFPTGAFGQSGDSGLSPQLIGDPNLLQLLCQQGNFLQQGNYLTLSIPNRPNPSPAAIEELDGNVTAKATGTASPACPAQLPGSLSTLRNYYNMTNTSEPLTGDQPAAKLDTLSPSKVCIVSPPTVTDSYQITSDQYVNMRVVSSDDASLGDQGTLHMTRGERPTLLCGDDSASTVNSAATSVAVVTDSSPVSMPGSLSSLRSYYSSLTQKTGQNASVGPSADHNADHIRTADRQTSSCETLNSALNLSKQRQGDRNKIQGTAGIEATDTVRPCLSPEEESIGVAASVKKMLNNGSNGQHPLSSYMLGSASTSSAATPLRILPKISESWTLSAASPASSQLSDDQNRPDSVASSISSSVHLPPKKRRKVASPDPTEMPLNECCVVVGNEKVPLSVFMSRLDSRSHQIVINQIQSALIGQQALAATSAEDMSSKLPVVASRVNPSSAAGLACVPKLNANVSGMETRNCAALSIPSSVTSQNIHLSDVGVTRGKKTPQVPAKKGYGKTDEKESHSNGGGSFQLPSLLSSSSSSCLSQFSSPSLSGQNPVLQHDEDGDLPLHVAVAQGELRVVEQIVNMMRALNATIDCRNYLRQTPLHVAVVTGDDDIVRCLLEAGASPNIADRNGQNCFHLAVQYKQVECLKVLFTCTESRPDLLNYEGMTPLHLAVKLNLPEAVSTLLIHGVQRDAVDGKSGHTALYMAADMNRLRIAEILLSSKANVQIASYSGCSPVQAASSKSFHEMVKLLVKHGGTSDPALTERSPDSKDSSEFGAHNRKGKV